MEKNSIERVKAGDILHRFWLGPNLTTIWLYSRKNVIMLGFQSAGVGEVMDAWYCTSESFTGTIEGIVRTLNFYNYKNFLCETTWPLSLKSASDRLLVLLTEQWSVFDGAVAEARKKHAQEQANAPVETEEEKLDDAPAKSNLVTLQDAKK